VVHRNDRSQVKGFPRMISPVRFNRAAAVVGVFALFVGPMASDAFAAPRKKMPAPSITSRPQVVTNARSATFAFTDSVAGAMFQCALDSRAFTACTSPATYAGPLAAGGHAFKVRATRPSARPSAAVTATWTIDLAAPPAPAFTAGPASPSAQPTATFGFADAEAGVTFLCALDNAAPVACTSPRTVPAGSDGSHTFSVAARDAAGNVSAATSRSWTVDRTPPPAPFVVTGPATLTNATHAAFEVYDADPTAVLTCARDGGSYGPCGPTATFSGLAEGAHTFDVRAADALGNAAQADTFAWTVDLTAPTPPAIVAHPDAMTNKSDASFTVDGHGASALRCAVDSETDFTACTTPFTLAALADGAHTFWVRARDAAGNDSGATPYRWTVDTTPPAAPVVTGPARLTNGTTAHFQITAADATTLTCALDAGPTAPCVSGVTYTGLRSAPHTVTVTATDPAGNAATTGYAWRVDAVAPAAAVRTPATLTAPVTITFTEPVTGISAASPALRVVGNSTAIAASRTCRSASGVTVSCHTSRVRTVTLHPARPLMPGQRYVIIATPHITDVAGNALPRTSTNFRAATTVQENSVAVRYAWRTVRSTSALGGSYLTEHAARAALSYPFTGRSITWYTVKGPDQGTASVWVDGVKKATVNDYAARRTYQIAHTVTGLRNGTHVLRILITGRKGNRKATGTYVSVDAVKASAGTLVPNPAATTFWPSTTLKASGAHATTADLAGAAASTTFHGTSVTWYTTTSRSGGLAKIYLDGLLKATYDLYSATTNYDVHKTISKLTNAVHTVKIVVTGTHRRGAHGTTVQLDRLVIR
jgi:hypothetical protein